MTLEIADIILPSFLPCLSYTSRETQMPYNDSSWVLLLLSSSCSVETREGEINSQTREFENSTFFPEVLMFWVIACVLEFNTELFWIAETAQNRLGFVLFAYYAYAFVCVGHCNLLFKQIMETKSHNT